jgi:hypothetical protein
MPRARSDVAFWSVIYSVLKVSERSSRDESSDYVSCVFVSEAWMH